MEAIQAYRECTDALRDFAGKIGFTDCVIGLSGGMDSALVAVMCVDAFGADHVHAYMMPGPYSTGHSVDDARELASNLGIDAQIISILEPFEAFERVLSKPCKGEFTGLASENTQARCRMVCLMALSNKYGWMMVNTGNKSEAMMGYSTLYGDTAGAFAPIGGLYKTTVYEVARARNAQAEAQGMIPPISEHIFTKPPSAELAPDQEDEKSLGIDYASLDRILIGHFERGIDAASLASEDCPLEEVERVLARAHSYAFKRAMEPPYPAASFYGE